MEVESLDAELAARQDRLRAAEAAAGEERSELEVRVSGSQGTLSPCKSASILVMIGFVTFSRCCQALPVLCVLLVLHVYWFSNLFAFMLPVILDLVALLQLRSSGCRGRRRSWTGHRATFWQRVTR